MSLCALPPTTVLVLGAAGWTLIPVGMHRLDDACTDGRSLQCELSARAGVLPKFDFFEYPAPWAAGLPTYVLFAAILLHYAAALIMLKIRRLGDLRFDDEADFKTHAANKSSWAVGNPSQPVDIEDSKKDIVMMNQSYAMAMQTPNKSMVLASPEMERFLDDSIDFEQFVAVTLSREHNC